MKNLLIVLIIISISSCSKQAPQLKTGDLIFIGNSNSALSLAIKKVTETQAATNFSHLGIVEIQNGKPYVIHSNSYAGVCIEPLDSFKLKSASPQDSAFVFRFSESLNIDVNKAIAFAKKELGKPYNNSYILEDKGYYCSEFIYTIFETDSVFKLNPMTFKNPDSEEFNPIWIKHYEKLGIEIPEGKLGCNPNKMASNKSLEFIAKF